MCNVNCMFGLENLSIGLRAKRRFAASLCGFCLTFLKICQFNCLSPHIPYIPYVIFVFCKWNGMNIRLNFNRALFQSIVYDILVIIVSTLIRFDFILCQRIVYIEKQCQFWISTNHLNCVGQTSTIS